MTAIINMGRNMTTFNIRRAWVKSALVELLARLKWFDAEGFS